MKKIHTEKRGAHSGPHKFNRSAYGSMPVWQRRMMGVFGADWKEYDEKQRALLAAAKAGETNKFSENL